MNYKSILVILVVLILLPFILNFFMHYPTMIGFIDENNQDGWIGYFGAVIGGFVTLLGVKITLDHQRKQDKDNKEKEQKKFQEELRLQYLPYLDITYNENDNSITEKNVPVFIILKDKEFKIYSNYYEDNPTRNVIYKKIPFLLKSIGNNSIKSINLKNPFLEEYMILTKNVLEPGNSIAIDINFFAEGMKDSYSIELDFIYEDLLTNRYSISCLLNLSINNNTLSLNSEPFINDPVFLYFNYKLYFSETPQSNINQAIRQAKIDFNHELMKNHPNDQKFCFEYLRMIGLYIYDVVLKSPKNQSEPPISINIYNGYKLNKDRLILLAECTLFLEARILSYTIKAEIKEKNRKRTIRLKDFKIIDSYGLEDRDLQRIGKSLRLYKVKPVCPLEIDKFLKLFQKIH